MRGVSKRVLLGCAGTLLPRGGGAPRSQRVDGGSTSGPRRRRRRGRAGPKLLRAKEDSCHPTSLRGRSVPRPRRLFSAERGAGGRSSRRSPDFDCQLLRTRWEGVPSQRGSAQRNVERSPGHHMCGQEQGVRRISDGARGGLGVGPLRREPRTCRSRERGQHGQLAAPTVAAPTQAA